MDRQLSEYLPIQLEELKRLAEDKLVKVRQDYEHVQILVFTGELTKRQGVGKIETLKRMQEDLYMQLGRIIEAIRDKEVKPSKKLCGPTFPLISFEAFGDVCSAPCCYDDTWGNPTFKKTRKHRRK